MDTVQKEWEREGGIKDVHDLSGKKKKGTIYQHERWYVKNRQGLSGKKERCYIKIGHDLSGVVCEEWSRIIKEREGWFVKTAMITVSRLRFPVLDWPVCLHAGILVFSVQVLA